MEKGNKNINQSVILNLIQDLQRLSLLFRNSVRGRFQIKFGMTPLWNTTGFTLIELLVVVLIIGVLAAIALPQYQKAVLKSRYSGLMPIASAVANAQEIYYMEKGNYSTDITQLDIKAPSGAASAEIEVNDGTDTRFDYVLAARADAPGLAYVMYQKHSEQFPDTIMCEANDTLNSPATWLCKESLKGTEVTSGSLQGTGWTAYLLKGSDSAGNFSTSEENETTDPETPLTIADLNETFTKVFSSNAAADGWRSYSNDVLEEGKTISVISPNEIIVYNPDGSEYEHYSFNPSERYMDFISTNGTIMRRYLGATDSNDYRCYQLLSSTGELLSDNC